MWTKKSAAGIIAFLTAFFLWDLLPTKQYQSSINEQQSNERTNEFTIHHIDHIRFNSFKNACNSFIYFGNHYYQYVFVVHVLGVMGRFFG